VPDETREISRDLRASAFGWFVFAVCGVILAAGLAAGFKSFGMPFLQILSARGWRDASCEIVSSRVDGGNTYRVDVTYRYFVDDRGYLGDRYKFALGSSAGYRWKAAIVARLAPGTRTACWVNPADPTDAVIERGLTADLWFGLMALIPIIIGGGGIRAVMANPAARPTYTKAVHGGEPVTLRLRFSRSAKLAIVIRVTLFWNVIVAVFVYNAESFFFGQGDAEWLRPLFPIPFVLAAIGLVAIVIHHLERSNPRLTLTVNHPIVALGEELLLNWAIEGRVEKLTRFRIAVEGRETATYPQTSNGKSQRGRSTSVFATIPLADQIPPGIAGTGRARARIPADTMHSFEANFNKVFWVIRVRGGMSNWPDIDDEFPITVAPGRP
jgi:hypothetical protein